MSLECAECEHDIRGGHDMEYSRYTFAPKVSQLVYSAEYGESTVEWLDDEQMEARIRNGMGMVAHQRFDQLAPAPESPSSQTAGADRG